MSGPGTPHPLHGNQMKAVDPVDTIWLSASAGTGKTQVLSSRVLRLLLRREVDPSQILCLTFTKAGATEMAARINDKLARWVRLEPAKLALELKAIGADFGPDAIARARTLFAAVLDCPGGGLRIDTIHAFAQWLLAAFPNEAGLTPGSRAMEDRDRILLARQVLADLLVRAESDPLGDPQLLTALADLSLRMGPEDVEGWLLRCAEAQSAWFGPGSWQEPLRPHVERLLGLSPGLDDAALAAMCADDAFDVEPLRHCLEVNRAVKGIKGHAAADAIGHWLGSAAVARLGAIDALSNVFLTKAGTLRSTTAQEKIDANYLHLAEAVCDAIAAVAQLRTLKALADRLVPALRLGRAFALAWDEAKKREGLIDFDDQIRLAAGLLNTSSLSDWIRYKLDRRFDHVLVDEAQDTNAAQWQIIDALTDDFFAGEGQHGQGVMRTLFVVGDYKQAIFRFQGTSPENFARARDAVRERMHGAARNAEGLRDSRWSRELREYGLDRSFRTAQPVLDFVDRAITHIGHENFGLDRAADRHRGEERPGYVALWRPVGDPAGMGDDGDEDEAADNWLSRPDRQMAERIARQIKHWMDHGFPLVKGGQRRATPGDVMVLVRKRRELAGLIVARLHAAGVPVAGVDRLRLGAPLAVRDLVAALRFAAQPFDDLNLACLLGSPLIGWSQEQLLAHGYRDRHVRLWDHLRRSRDPDAAAAIAQLLSLLERADFGPPQELLHWLLVGPWQGRRKLVARLGREANDPIDELLNAAGAYATTATPSLVGFLAWFDAGEGELKREASGPADLVRVMTAHGSKGLQAPIVILADATGNPERKLAGRLVMPDPAAPGVRAIPMPALRKEERVGRLAEEQALADREDEKEHWRLLYVAMTRAEEALFVGGALAAREVEPAPGSWFARLRGLFAPDAWIADPIFGERLECGDVPVMLGPAENQRSALLPLPPPMPRWLECAVGAEPRPPKPLAPSALGEEQSSDPPWPPGAAIDAARRGVLIHRLLERLPDVSEADRPAAASAWLARNAADLGADLRAEMLASALAVVSNPDWSELFSPKALAEVPIAAQVGGQVIAGTIDRLLVGAETVRIVDFKTARRPPAGIDTVPVAILRQMAAYAAALAAVFPGRRVEAALLYTAAPVLIEIPEDLLERHKPAFVTPE
jgi:ATP-dependent helicase/nuclease subunit A